MKRILPYLIYGVLAALAVSMLQSCFVWEAMVGQAESAEGTAQLLKAGGSAAVADWGGTLNALYGFISGVVGRMGVEKIKASGPGSLFKPAPPPTEGV